MLFSKPRLSCWGHAFALSLCILKGHLVNCGSCVYAACELKVLSQGEFGCNVMVKLHSHLHTASQTWNWSFTTSEKPNMLWKMKYINSISKEIRMTLINKMVSKGFPALKEEVIVCLDPVIPLLVWVSLWSPEQQFCDGGGCFSAQGTSYRVIHMSNTLVSTCVSIHQVIQSVYGV